MQEQFRAHTKVLAKALTIFSFIIIMLSFCTAVYIKYPEQFGAELSTDNLAFVDAPIDEIVDGIHVSTGFVEGEGLELVVQNCTTCHSAQLVTQNRMGREGWKATILWMQQTQNLWDLGQNEAPILDYLSNNYAPKAHGRRKNLEVVEWYPLNN